MATTKKRKSDEGKDPEGPEASEATAPAAKPPPLEKPGQHGLQRKPRIETSTTRLCRLLNLTTDVSLETLLREAADEIETLRRK